MKTRPIFLLASFAATALLSPAPLQAHCDTLEGPVVIAAKAAIGTGDVTPVLRWIQPADEPAIRQAFARTLTVRKASPEAAALADDYFFETLVRLHRAGEGAAYTGLKSGAPEGIEAEADRALESGDGEKLASDVASRLRHRIEQQFAKAHALRAHADHHVDAGRAYVAAYVDYVHLVDAAAKLGDQPRDGSGAHVH